MNDHAHFRRPARSLTLAAAGFGLLAFASPAQAQDAGHAVQPTGEARVLRADTDAGLYSLGESPVAELLDVLGPDVSRYTQHVMTLANPFFEGRAPGTKGNLLAQDYIEFWFRQFGLEPAFPVTEKAADGTEVVTPGMSYRQPFEVGLELTVRKAEMGLVLGGADPVVLEAGKDFSVLGMSGAGTVTAPVSFVGYSIVAGRNEYGSYFGENADLTGKIAMVLRFEPMNEDGTSQWAKEGWSGYAALNQKITAAVRRNASGIIVVNPPGAKDERVGRLATWRETQGVGAAGRVPVVMVTEDVADRIVRAGDPEGRSLLDLRRLADEKGQVIELPNAQVAFDVDAKLGPNPTANMGAILRGRGALADEFVIIGSHFDHVGYGWFGSRNNRPGEIHPGADDNASGTSGMLLLAERLSRYYASADAPTDLRSVFFMGYSAEESGLEGSRYYVQNMAYPKEKHYLMLNLDMIGRLRNGELEANGVGTATGLEEMMRPLLDSSGLNVAAKPGGTGPSDHASFYAAEIPVMFFFTGLHEEYHSTTDVAATVNPVGAVKVVDLVEKIALTAASRTEPLTFQSTSSGEQAMGGPRRVRVRFGVAPGDYSGSKPGVLIGQVFPGTSAADAGLQAQDLMTKWNDTELKSVEDWMPLLEKAEPGDEVTIVIIRDGKEQTVKATLKGRSTGG